MKHTPIIQNPGFRSNLTQRPTVAPSKRAIIVRALWILYSMHGPFCSGYQATVTPHRCKLYLLTEIYIISLSPSVCYLSLAFLYFTSLFSSYVSVKLGSGEN